MQNDAIDTVGQIDLLPTGLLFLDPTMSFAEWAAIGAYLQRAAGSVNWWLGDWLNEGEKRYGETYTQAISETGIAYQTLANMKWVANKVEFSRRRENLSWKHHAEVAGLEIEEQEQWLDAAEEHDYSASAMKRSIKDAREVAAVASEPEPFFTGDDPDEHRGDNKTLRLSGGEIRLGTKLDLKCGYLYGPMSGKEKSIVRLAYERISEYERGAGLAVSTFSTGLLIGIDIAAPDWGRNLPDIIRRYSRLLDRLT